MSAHYDALADRAERGELPVKPGTVRRGDESRAAAQQLLMEAAGASAIEDAMRIAVGRPRVGEAGGASPVVRARVPQALKDRMQAAAAQEQRPESEIVRDALIEYFASRPAS